MPVENVPPCWMGGIDHLKFHDTAWSCKQVKSDLPSTYAFMVNCAKVILKVLSLSHNWALAA